MESRVESDGILLLLDRYTPDGRYLQDSLKRAGYGCLTAVIEENDFLPEGITSVYDMILGYDKDGESIAGKPRYFNEIEVPDCWSVSKGDGQSGAIVYHHEEKGKIRYAGLQKKYLVEAVDWYDRKGVVRVTDHYNRWGRVCARTVYNARGLRILKSWFSPTGKEILTENYITGDIILNDGGTVRWFRTKTDLLADFLERNHYAQGRIFYNSLSTPFQISNRLSSPRKKDVLFWQEPVGEEIPGNMRNILDGYAGRTEKIIVQRRDSYDKLLGLGVPGDMVRKLGFIYPFRKENSHRPEALICTNSDQIEHIQEIVEALPQMHFHIAAITQMSPVLTALETYGNVSLYPEAEAGLLDRLFGKCCYYFDINHWAEIVSAVYQAFLYNQPIFAFQETAHRREYVADAHIYPAGDFGRMVSDVRATMENQPLMERHLKMQREDAMAENEDTYSHALLWDPQGIE